MDGTNPDPYIAAAVCGFCGSVLFSLTKLFFGWLWRDIRNREPDETYDDWLERPW